MMQQSDVDLLMIGKTGNGKSSTGNAILRRKIFKSISSTTSVTTKIDSEVSEFNGRVIKVVDGPGVGDTRLNNEEAVKLVTNAMEQAISTNPRGYHAFLLVVRYGGRFTVEDKDTIAFLKKVFGESFVRNYCILVLTCGDNFEQDSEETGQSFSEWCREQTGIFKELLNECDNRAVLFNNRTTDDSKRREQLGKLLQVVDSLRFQGRRYTDENFAMARAARERAIVEAKIPIIRDETMQETSLILQKLQELQSQEDLSAKIKPLEELKIRADNLYKKICTEDKGTGALHEICDTVKTIQGSVDAEIKFCIRVKKEREENKMQLAEFNKMVQEQKAQQEKINNELQAKYRKVKEANESNLLEKIVNGVTWLLGKIFDKIF